MDFVRGHVGKMNLWPVEHFFEHICPHFKERLLLHPPKSDDIYAKKVFNWSKVHLSEVTSYKIETSSLSLKFLWLTVHFLVKWKCTTNVRAFKILLKGLFFLNINFIYHLHSSVDLLELNWLYALTRRETTKFNFLKQAILIKR